MADQNLLQNKTRDLTPQCKVNLYLWKTQSVFSDSSTASLADTQSFDISSRIRSVSFQKSMSEAAGTFTITVSNNADFEFQDDEKSDTPLPTRARRSSGDWKDLVKRGTWCTIYMSQDGGLDIQETVKSPTIRPDAEGKYLRCIGFIERITVKSEMDENGAFDVVYELSGRDFGVVYEDTVIWHNLFQFDKALIERARTQLRVDTTNSIDRAIKTVHDLFFGPANLGIKGSGSDPNSLTSIARQWILPNRLLRDLGVNEQVPGGTFWGSISNITNPEGEGFYGVQPTTMGFVQADITDFISGGAWDKLNQIAVREFHELFLETMDDGRPKLNFRPIPWAINKRAYPKAGSNIKLYKEVPSIVVPAEDVINFELGEDNHNRYNSFLVTTNSTLINETDNISILRKQFPRHQPSSIQRYGFRPMHVTIPALTNNELLQNGTPDANLLLEYNEVLYDYWNFSIFAESGTLSMFGRNDVKIGKCLLPDGDVPYISGRRYYIEGYSDTFTVLGEGEAEWLQEVSITRGYESVDLSGSGAGFRDRDNKFIQSGEFTKRGR